MTETINEELKDLMTDAGEDRLKFLTHHKRPDTLTTLGRMTKKFFKVAPIECGMLLFQVVC